MNMSTDQLGHIILQLLADRTLVVLPGFGGFVKDHVGAELDALRNRVHPPRNTVIFNSKLNHNDGLLVAAIASTLEISYAEADVRMTDAISELRFRLNSGVSVAWEDLGVLKRTVSGNIEFVAVARPAIQADFFGLKPVSLTKVEKDNVDRMRQLVATDGPVASRVRTLPLKRVASYAAAAMAIGFLAWLPIQNGALNNGKMLAHQLNPFAMNTQTAYSPREFREDWINKGFEREDAFAARFEQEYLSLYLAKDALNPIIVKTDAIPTTEVDHGTEVSASPINEKATYFRVIAATFATRSMADEHVTKMISRGFNAEYAGKDASGHLVAYGSYPSMEDATKMLASVSLSNKEARVVSGN
jgi:hypothetical protein